MMSFRRKAGDEDALLELSVNASLEYIDMVVNVYNSIGSQVT